MTKSQGDARGGAYANDPHSHADVYTSLETCTRDPRRARSSANVSDAANRIDVSMAQTMLYVNEHVQRRPVGRRRSTTAAIRSFGPGDYIVVDRRQR